MMMSLMMKHLVSLSVVLLLVAPQVASFTSVSPTARTFSSTSTKSSSSLYAAAAEKKDDNAQQQQDKARKTALDGVMNQIEKSYGKGSIMKLGDADQMTVASISTGALTLDAALGGGYPKGRVVEIYGPESSGKTTLALEAIASVQKRQGTAAFVDAEHALDPAYANGLGVNVKDLYVCQPDSGEMALDVVDKLVRSSAVDVIVVDSVAALVPRAELEGDMSDSQIGLQARLMSKAMRKITGSLAMSQCTVIFINQLRSKVGVIYGSPEVTSGGNALKFYASVRLDIRRKEILPDNTGIRVKVRVVKNKVAAPFKAVNLDILFGQGIDGVGCTLDAAEELGILERKGSWYSYNGENVAQGRLNVIEKLKKDDVFCSEVELRVKEALANFGKDDDKETEQVDDDDINMEADDSMETLEDGEDIAEAISSSSKKKDSASFE